MTDFRPGGFQQLPLIVKNLLIINALVFLLQYVLELRGIDLNEYLALFYWQSPMFRWWQVITHMFMHANISHIFFNMFALWMFGRILENAWGPQRFLLFYLICGIGAAICHMGVLTFEYTRFQNAFMHYQQNPSYSAFVDFVKHHLPNANTNSISPSNWDATGSINAIHQYYNGHMLNEPTVGASGAVFGLLFAFGYLFPNTELYIYFIPIPIKAKWFVTGYALIELFSGIQNSAGDNVAHFAHLGGMLFAFILLRIWNDKLRNRFY
jgi:membrane associated rhomboid family serine protease